MIHQRQTIRHAAKTALLSHTDAGTNVFTTRVYAYDLDKAGSPGCMIYTLDEESGFDSLSRRLLRRLQLVIEFIAAVNDTLDDTLDKLAAQAETALAANPTLSGTCKDLELTRTQIAMRKDGEKLTGGIVLTFTVTYRTQAANPAAQA